MEENLFLEFCSVCLKLLCLYQFYSIIMNFLNMISILIFCFVFSIK